MIGGRCKNSFVVERRRRAAMVFSACHRPTDALSEASLLFFNRTARPLHSRKTQRTQRRTQGSPFRSRRYLFAELHCQSFIEIFDLHCRAAGQNISLSQARPVKLPAAVRRCFPKQSCGMAGYERGNEPETELPSLHFAAARLFGCMQASPPRREFRFAPTGCRTYSRR